jgi:hypothetical protein
MEVPEWVRVVSHGTCEELREFIRANPGFDWDNTLWNSQTAVVFTWFHNPFPRSMLDIMYYVGGAKFDAICNSNGTPMDLATRHGDTRLVELLLSYGVQVTSPIQLVRDENVLETILERSDTLTTGLVNSAIAVVTENRHDFRWRDNWRSILNSLNRWLVSHNYRRDASLCVAWTLSQLTGTMWPDTREPLLKRLMETRVREW